MNDEKLEEMCAVFGTVASAKVVTDDRVHLKFRKIAYVSFEYKDDADDAVESLSGSDFDGHTLFCRRIEGLEVAVKNLHPSVDSKRLCEAFSRFGTVAGARVVNTKSKFRCSFVCFSCPEEARLAAELMDGEILVEYPPLRVVPFFNTTKSAAEHRPRSVSPSPRCLPRHVMRVITLTLF